MHHSRLPCWQVPVAPPRHPARARRLPPGSRSGGRAAQPRPPVGAAPAGEGSVAQQGSRRSSSGGEGGGWEPPGSEPAHLMRQPKSPAQPALLSSCATLQSDGRAPDAAEHRSTGWWPIANATQCRQVRHVQLAARDLGCARHLPARGHAQNQGTAGAAPSLTHVEASTGSGRSKTAEARREERSQAAEHRLQAPLPLEVHPALSGRP
jgi:hypothetical protein